MGERIEIPEANLRNIAIFSDEPGDEIIDEIKTHVRSTARPQEWRGHSHTKPAQGSFVVYIEEFDVPAPDSVRVVAPCPCCHPNHAWYKNKGKIAWFPHESVVRLIGPQCFANINAGGHKDAIVDLRRRQRRRSELATIALHAPALENLIEVCDEALPIADDLDDFMIKLNRILDSDLRLPLWREVKGGMLTIAEKRRVPFQRADGTGGERTEEVKVLFDKIVGQSMIDRSAQPLGNKLAPFLSGLVQLAERLAEAGTPEALTDREREHVAVALPKGRAAAVEILTGLADRQQFLTSPTMKTLSRWAQHENAPIRFKIERKDAEVHLSAPDRSRTTPQIHTVRIRKNATKPIPQVPELASA